MMQKIVWVCSACGTSFWSDEKPEGEPRLCPNCLQEPLAEAGSETLSQLSVPEPEGIIPFSFAENYLQTSLERFVGRIPFRPRDLTVENLASRLQKVYLPQWWVDVDVKAQWQAEIGFHYEVVSHEDSYKGGWVENEVRETRVRWEPRVGLLDKYYDNISAPAIHDEQEFGAQVGSYTLKEIQPPQDNLLSGALVRIAQRDAQDAWSQAEMNLRGFSTDECRQACKGDQIRQFQWTADYQNQHWTQLLLPVYVTYYQDVNRKRRWVMINGQSGRIGGEMEADLNQALRSSVWILAAAGVLLLLGLLLALASAGSISTLLIVAGLGVGLAAFYPFGRAWLFNNHQTPDQDGALT